MKTKPEIITETAENYNSKTVAHFYDDQGYLRCKYLSPDGNMCAVGRCMTEEALQEYGDFVGSADDLHRKAVGLDSILKPEYREHSVAFWMDLQVFHDEEKNWDENGMTKEGKEEYENLLIKYPI